MLLVFAGIALVASVPLLGGHLSRLVDVRLTATWAVLLSAAIQVGITAVARGGSHTVHVALHLSSYVLVAWFLIANRRIAGMPLVALGGCLNLLAISLNGGVMPASASALRIAGIDTSGGFENSAALAHEHLAFLGDVIPVPGPWPIGNVLSIGDLIIFIGALVVLHRTCGSRLALRLQPPLIRPKTRPPITSDKRGTRTSSAPRSSRAPADGRPAGTRRRAGVNR
jgi:hypothetical protein